MRRIIVAASVLLSVIAAIGATQGSDAVAAEWHVNGVAESAGLAFEPGFAKAVVFTTTGINPVTIECSTAGGVWIGESTIYGGDEGLIATFSFGSCEVTSSGPCHLASKTLATNILTFIATAGTPIEITFKPLTGTILFETTLTGTGCPPKTLVATGKLVAELATGSSEEVEHGLVFKSASGGTLSSVKGELLLSLVSRLPWSFR